MRCGNASPFSVSAGKPSSSEGFPEVEAEVLHLREELADQQKDGGTLRVGVCEDQQMRSARRGTRRGGSRRSGPRLSLGGGRSQMRARAANGPSRSGSRRGGPGSCSRGGSRTQPSRRSASLGEAAPRRFRAMSERFDSRRRRWRAATRRALKNFGSSFSPAPSPGTTSTAPGCEADPEVAPFRRRLVCGGAAQAQGRPAGRCPALPEKRRREGTQPQRQV